jgi:hypothetical protein
MFGCSSKKKEHPFFATEDFFRTNREFVEIDIRDPRIMKKDELPSIVDSMFFIKLPDEPLLGVIDKVIFNDSVMYILDAFQTRQVLIYKILENSFQKVSNLGRGPNEYLAISDIALNRERLELVLNDHRSSIKLVFDLSGKFKRKEPFLPAFYFDCIEGVYLNQLGYLQSFSEEFNYHIVSSGQDSTIRRAFPYVPLQKTDYMAKGLFRNWQDDVLFLPTHSDTVYCIDSDSSYYVRYTLRQKKSLWEEADRQLSHSETSRMIKEEGYTTIGNFREGRDHILFNVSKSHSSGRILSSQYLYDKRTGFTYEYPNSDNSSSTSDAVKSDVIFDYYALSQPIAVWGDFFVSVFDPISLKYTWEDAVSKGLTVEFIDPEFESLIKNADNDSNPALVLYRLK